VAVEHVDLRSMLNQALQVLEVTFLGGDVRRSIAVVVLDIQVEVGLHEHFKDIESVLEPCTDVQGIVALIVRVVDLDTSLSQNTHNLAVPVLRCNPERVQPFIVVLVDVDHLVFQHQSHKFLTALRSSDFQRETLSSHEIDVVVEDAAQVHEVMGID